MKATLIFACILFSIASPSAHAGGEISDSEFLEMVGAVEGPDGYGTITGFAPFDPPRPLTRMTVAEVLEYQDQIRNAGAESTAVGRFQFIRNTLYELMQAEGISQNSLFDKPLQDKLARALLRKCDYYARDVRTTALANCLAGHWAALPMASGSKKGRSRYQGIAGNRHLVDLDEVVEVIEARMDGPPGISLEEAFREVQLTVVAVPLEVTTSRN